MFVFHYTDQARALLILDDGFIRPTPLDPSDLMPGERPVAWFSTNDVWETTAAKAFQHSDTGEVRLMTMEEQAQRIGVFRFKIAKTSIPGLMDWAAIRKAARIPKRVAKGLETALDAKPHEWFGSLDPVDIHSFTFDLETYDVQRGEWVTLGG